MACKPIKTDTNMHPSPLSFLLIKTFEGLSLSAYQCPAGIWTIGYGHTAGVNQGDTITQSQADYLLGQDVQETAHFLDTFNLDLRQTQYDALISLIFNIGTRAFAASTILTKIKADANDPTIREEFLRWVHSGGNVIPGLKKRREEEIRYYFSDL